MKFLHKKFLENEEQIGDEANNHSINETSRIPYFLNQFVIWIVIISILLFILKFLNITTYFNP